MSSLNIINDKLNLLSKLTGAKLLNALKIIGSYYYSNLLNKNVHYGLPVSMSFEPTTYCNLRCPECPSGLRKFNRATGMADLNFFQSFIDDVKDHLLYLTLYFQGEPFLHPDFLNMVRYASENNVYTATSTNAHFITDDNARHIITSGLDRLIISIDGTSQDIYQIYRRGGKLNKVLEGTKTLIEWKKKLKSKTPHTIFQFLVVRQNEHQIPDIYKLADELEVDEVRLKTAQVYNYKNGNDLIPVNEKYSRYTKQEDGTYKNKMKMANRCWRMWQGSVVTFDGKVVPCCFDKDAQHRLGDMQEHKLAHIWEGQDYKKFREAVLSGRETIDICKNCSEGTKVWA